MHCAPHRRAELGLEVPPVEELRSSRNRVGSLDRSQVSDSWRSSRPSSPTWSCSASHRLLFSAFCSASSRRSPTAAATARPTPRCRERRSHRACPATLPRTERLGWEDRQRRTIYSSLGVLGRVRTSACRRPRGRDQRNGALSVSPDTMMAKSRRGIQRKVAGIGIRPWEGRPTPLTLCKLADDPWVEALAPRPLPDSCANPRSQ